MSLNGYIKLRRGDHESAEKMMTECEQAIAEGNSIMMFPEGTRSADGRLRDFKHGAFTLALRSKAPILPIIVEGTSLALPKRGYVLQGYHQIRVRVLDAIPYSSFANLTVDTLKETVRDRFVAVLEPAEPSDTWVPARVFLS
jgi:1-acyl-sn-glycerol-3-phosphate acyltransferase